MAVLKGERQKSDNAIVPNQLWLQVFAGGYADPERWARHHSALGSSGAAAERGHPENPPQNWRTSFEGFRTFGLHFWRRGLLRGYFKWRRTNLPWQSNLPTPGQMVRCRMTMIFGGVNAAYEWTAKGRVSYNKQWALLRCSEEGQATVEAGLDAIRRAANASWFDWLEGSAPLFWNWSERYQREVRDGQPHFLIGSFGPPFLQPQASHRDPVKQKLMRAKVVKVRKLGYIKAGRVASGTSFFCVDKGPTDIRMVYNGTSCGLNNVLYSPHFGLPIVRETLRAILPGFYQCNLDLQDQFLNYKLHKSLRKYSGVDIHRMQSLAPKNAWWEEQRPARWERWERN
jgi:hypothetical protein